MGACIGMAHAVKNTQTLTRCFVFTALQVEGQLEAQQQMQAAQQGLLTIAGSVKAAMAHVQHAEKQAKGITVKQELQKAVDALATAMQHLPSNI